jgi:hypothetical protein
LAAVPECANGPRRNCFSVSGGTEGSNPSPSSGESHANLKVDIDISAFRHSIAWGQRPPRRRHPVPRGLGAGAPPRLAPDTVRDNGDAEGRVVTTAVRDCTAGSDMTALQIATNARRRRRGRPRPRGGAFHSHADQKSDEEKSSVLALGGARSTKLVMPLP